MTNKHTVDEDERAWFERKFKKHSQNVDRTVLAYCQKTIANIDSHYGAYIAVVVEEYLDLLNRGGKRIRGVLTIVGYQMCGGTNLLMISQAALAVEMIHAYMLVLDDIQDRSTHRRGGLTVHKALERKALDIRLKGDLQHMGLALGINAGLFGAHAAQEIVTNLDAPSERKLQVLNTLNKSLMITSYGQTSDIINQARDKIPTQEVIDMMLWKTAHYTFLNPLHIGMLLAGVGQKDLSKISEFALNIGVAFQAVDDIEGVFGGRSKDDKNSMDDIREGKRTLLIVHALKHSSSADRNFLERALGNKQLTPLQLERCQQIIKDTGGLEFARQTAADNVQKALSGLRNLGRTEKDWNVYALRFLTQFAKHLNMQILSKS